MVASKPRPNLAIPSDQLRIDICPITQRFSCQSSTKLKSSTTGRMQKFIYPPPDSFILLHPGFIFVETNLPRRTLVIPSNSRGKAVFRCFDVKWYDYSGLNFVPDDEPNITPVCDNALAYSDLFQVDVFLNLVNAVKFLLSISICPNLYMMFITVLLSLNQHCFLDKIR